MAILKAKVNRKGNKQLTAKTGGSSFMATAKTGSTPFTATAMTGESPFGASAKMGENPQLQAKIGGYEDMLKSKDVEVKSAPAPKKAPIKAPVKRKNVETQQTGKIEKPSISDIQAMEEMAKEQEAPVVADFADMPGTSLPIQTALKRSAKVSRKGK